MMLLLVSCQSDPSSKTTPSINQAPSTTVAPATVPEPPFTQEGVLEFQGQGANKPLLRLNIEIAHDPDQRNQGLMWRKKMGENEGMLFVFDAPEMQSFWMRNTYISLDLIYINEKFEVVTVLKNVPTLNDTPRPSGKPAQYVVEVNAGVADKYSIVPGTLVVWLDFVTGQALGKSAVPAF